MLPVYGFDEIYPYSGFLIILFSTLSTLGYLLSSYLFISSFVYSHLSSPFMILRVWEKPLLTPLSCLIT